MSHQPYTYLIRFKITGQLYYGVQWRKDCHPSKLWVNYFTSSKLIKSLIKEHGKDSFEVLYTKNHATKEAALKWEEMYLVSVDGGRNPNYLNKHIPNKHLYREPGFKHTEEWKLEHSKRMTGEGNPQYGKTGEHAQWWGRHHTEERNSKAREWATGRIKTQEEIDKCRATKGDKYKGENAPAYGKFDGDHPRAKLYVVTFLDGHEEFTAGMSKFCKNNNLTATLMAKVAKGKDKQHKGFVCRYFNESDYEALFGMLVYTIYYAYMLIKLI